MARVDIVERWSQIEVWLSANVPDAIPFSPAGATSAAFAKAEATLGYALPREVKEFLVVHDGSAHPSPPRQVSFIVRHLQLTTRRENNVLVSLRSTVHRIRALWIPSVWPLGSRKGPSSERSRHH